MTRLLTNKDSRGTSQNQLLSSIDPSGQGKPLSLGDQDLTVSVIIPARNEKNNLPSVLSRLASDCYEIILVDGHSSDDTVEVAQSLCPGLRVIEQPATGKGDALAAGLRVAKGNVIVFMDADGSNDPAEIPLFVEAIVRGADYAKGSRFLPGGGSRDITRIRKTGNLLLTAIVNLLFGTKYTDLCYGFNAIRASCLDALDVNCSGFEVETLINVRLAKMGSRVAEIPSLEQKRISGSSSLHPLRDGIRILKLILWERFSKEYIREFDCLDEPGELFEASG
jgi:glycosyltransferase involved in cell wall biosynthesis